MSEQPIKFQYQTGIAIWGYAFSASNNSITLSDYVGKLENARIREAIQYEAQRARYYYVEAVNRIKTAGGSVNNFRTKSEAVKRAKEDAHTLYADVWSEAENTYRNPPQASTAAPQCDSADISLCYSDDTKRYLVTVSELNKPSAG